MAASRQFGVTPAISLALPTEDELRLNESLITELRAQNNFEAADDTDRRKKVLALLQKVTEQFVRHVGLQKGLAPSVIESAGGKVSTFGSYRLGVYGPGMLSIIHMHLTKSARIRHRYAYRGAETRNSR
jgi:poly(A) polymerase